MLKDIIQDCPLNNSIKLEFEDKIIEGQLIDFNEQRIKVRTENKIIVLTTKVLENLLTYEVLDSVSEVNFKEIKEEIIQVEPISEVKNDEVDKQNDKKEKVVTSEEFNLFKAQIDNFSNKYPTNTEFVFKFHKLKKFEVSNDEFEVSQQLQSLSEKYNYALNQQDKERRFKEILNTLKLLQSNNYFNDNIRYNIALIFYKLNNFSEAIETLNQTQKIVEKPEFLDFISYLYYKNNDLRNCLYHYSEFQKNTKFVSFNFPFFIQAISKEKAFNLFGEVFYYILLEKINFNINDWYFAVYYLLKNNNIDFEFAKPPENIDELIYQINRNINVLKQSEPVEYQNYINDLKQKEQKSLSSNAEIIDYWESSNSGNLRFFDDKGRQFLANFNESEIIDPDVKRNLQKVSSKNPIQVICFIRNNHKKWGTPKRAYGIHFPKSFDFEIDLIKNQIKKDDRVIAEGLMEILKIQFPNESYEQIEQQISDIETEIIEETTIKHSKYKFKKPKDSIYRKADLARQRKDWENAKKLFQQAIENNDNRESAVKDLASILSQEGKLDDAIHLVEKYLSKMQNVEAAYNFISHLYLNNKQFEKAVEILKKLLTTNPTKSVDKRKRSLEIKRRISYCYYKSGDYTNAKKLLNEILRKSPDDTIAQKWLNALLDAEKSGSYEEIETLFNEADFAVLKTGYSSLINVTLENCDFTGLKETEKASEEYSYEILNRIRKYIDENLGAKPKERASYRLTEARLMQKLEPEKEYEIRTVLAKYCNDMALSFAGSNYPAQVIRNFHIEAFSLENNWVNLARQVSIFISSFYLAGERLIIENQKGISIEKAFDNIFNLDEEPKSFWDNILEMSIVNSTITAQILGRFYRNNKAKKSLVSFFDTLEISSNENISEKDFKTKWNDLREKRKSEQDIWFNTINALSNTTDFNSLVAIIHSSLDQLRTTWIHDLDLSRLDTIVRDIVYNSNDYLKQASFDEKERLQGILNTSIERLVEDIENKPTRFSYEGFLPLLEHIQELLQTHYESVLLTANPNVSLHILGEFIVINNQLEIQVAVRNEDKEKAPIYDVSLSVENTNDVQLVGKQPTSYEAIRGGDERIIPISLKVSDELVTRKIGDIKLLSAYKSRNNEKVNELKSEHTISLYDESEFEPIDNIFARYANSNAVTDKEMFYGRDALIEEIVEKLISSKSKNVVIYGQKRSGKSSVLYHLKQALNETNKAFCIDFSLGSIITEWSITTFYDKILNEIDKEIRKLRRNGIETPDFTKPDYDTLEKRPTSLFQQTMENFLEQFHNFEGWKQKRLTVLIDEFTYLYSSIQRGTIPGDFMKTWKDIIDQSYFNSVLIGQDVMPDFMSKFANQFGVIEERRLSYLKPEDAKALIEKPIWYHKKDESRFIGNALDKVIEYTAGNPYYLQILGERLVNIMNDPKRKLIRVTEVTVKEAAESLIKGSGAIEEKNFDNLLTAGDADLEINPVNYTFEVLKQIALASKNIPSRECSKYAILNRIENDKIKERLDIILKDLDRRKVITINDEKYSIKVKLFNDWLLNR